MRTSLFFLSLFVCISSIFGQSATSLRSYTINENVEGKREAIAQLSISLELLQKMSPKATLFIDFGKLKEDPVSELTVSGSTTLMIDREDLESALQTTKAADKGKKNRLVNFRRLEPGTKLHFPPIDKKAFGKGTKNTSTTASSKPDLLGLSPTGNDDETIDIALAKKYRTVYNKEELIRPELLSLDFSDSQWGVRTAKGKLRISTATLMTLGAKSEVIIDFGKLQGDKDGLMIGGKAQFLFDANQISKLQEGVKAGTIKGRTVNTGIKIGFTNIELLLRCEIKTRGFGKGTRNSCSAASAKPELLMVVPNDGNNDPITGTNVGEGFTITAKYYTRSYKNRGILDQPSINIESQGIILAKFNVGIGNDNPLNEIGEEKGLMLSLSSGNDKPLGNVQCPCEIAKKKKEFVLWKCKGQIGDAKMVAQMIESGMINVHEDNLTNARHKHRGITIWDYERMIISTEDGGSALPVETVSGERGVDYDVKHPISHIRSAKLKRRKKPSSDIISIDIYNGDRSIALTSNGSDVINTITATFISEKGGKPFSMDLKLTNQNFNRLTYTTEIPTEKSKDIFDVEEYSLSVSFGKMTIAGATFINPTIEAEQKHGLANNSFDFGFSAYPNPTLSGEVTLDLGAEYDDVSVVVSDLSGRIISENQLGTISKTSLNLNAEAGIYLITVYSLNKQIGHFKITKR